MRKKSSSVYRNVFIHTMLIYELVSLCLQTWRTGQTYPILFNDVRVHDLLDSISRLVCNGFNDFPIHLDPAPYYVYLDKSRPPKNSVFPLKHGAHCIPTRNLAEMQKNNRKLLKHLVLDSLSPNIRFYQQPECGSCKVKPAIEWIKLYHVN